MTTPTPLCTRCLAPADPLKYYCECGEAIGQFTQYVPYVNIRFNNSIYGELWRRLLSPDTRLWLRCFSFGMLVLFAPIMFVGMFFVLRERWRARTEER